jgi:probable HAF family extracellular repeat protein
MTIKTSSLKRFTIALLITAAFGSSGYAQGISSLKSGSTSAAGAGLSTAHAGTATTSRGLEQNPGATLVLIPALPPILSQKLKLELGILDIPAARLANSTSAATKTSGNIGHYSSSSSTQRANADYLIRARRARSAAHDGAAITQRYFLTDLGTLGGTESFAYGINDKGQVVGSSRLAGDTSTHAFLYGNGRMIDLYPLNSGEIQTVGPTGINNSGQIASGLVVGGVYSPAILDSKSGEITLLGSLGGVTSFGFSGVATSISNLGDAVGYSYTDVANRHAFLYFNGLMTDIGSLGGYSAAAGVGDGGTVVGFSSTASNGSAQAFVYNNGVMTDIDPFGGESYARGVNNLGDVVGQFLIKDQTAHHAFLYREGIFHDIGFSESPETVAFAINDHGQVVGTTLVPYKDLCVDSRTGGYVVCTKYTRHAFLYQAGQRADLNRLIPAKSGWELGWAFDINSHGQIVGYGSVSSGFRAFLLTPAISKEQCKNGAWKSFGFKNQGQCIQFVNAGK